jgi:hypothetical protein
MTLSKKTSFEALFSGKRALLVLAFVYLALSTPLANRPLNHDEIYNTLCYLHTSPMASPTDTAFEKDMLDKFGLSWRTDWRREISLHPPFVYLFYYGWTRIFGDSEISLHAPPLLIGLLGLLLLYQIAAPLLGRRVAFAASLATACSTAWLGYSVQAVHAMFEAGIFLISLFFFTRYVRSSDKKDLVCLRIANLFGILIFYHYVVFLLAQALFFFLNRKKYQMRPVSFFLMGLVFLSFGVFFLSHYYAGEFNISFWSQVCPDFFQQTVSGLPFQVSKP